MQFLFLQTHEAGAFESVDREGGRVHLVLRLSGLHPAQTLHAQRILQDLCPATTNLSHVQSCDTDNRKTVNVEICERTVADVDKVLATDIYF